MSTSRALDGPAAGQLGLDSETCQTGAWADRPATAFVVELDPCRSGISWAMSAPPGESGRGRRGDSGWESAGRFVSVYGFATSWASVRGSGAARSNAAIPPLLRKCKGKVSGGALRDARPGLDGASHGKPPRDTQQRRNEKRQAHLSFSTKPAANPSEPFCASRQASSYCSLIADVAASPAVPDPGSTSAPTCCCGCCRGEV